MKSSIFEFAKSKTAYLLAVVFVPMAFLAACSGKTTESKPTTVGTTDAEKFVADAEKRYLDVSLKEGVANWVQENFITQDTEALSSLAKEETIKTIKELAEQARQFDGQNLSPDATRKLKLLKLALALPAPTNPDERKELAQISVRMPKRLWRRQVLSRWPRGQMPEFRRFGKNSSQQP